MGQDMPDLPHPRVMVMTMGMIVVVGMVMVMRMVMVMGVVVVMMMVMVVGMIVIVGVVMVMGVIMVVGVVMVMGVIMVVGMVVIVGMHQIMVMTVGSGSPLESHVLALLLLAADGDRNVGAVDAALTGRLGGELHARDAQAGSSARTKSAGSG